MNGERNNALAHAVERSTKRKSELVRGITTERTLDRWIKGEIEGKPDYFKASRVARRLGHSYEELFGG